MENKALSNQDLSLATNISLGNQAFSQYLLIFPIETRLFPSNQDFLLLDIIYLSNITAVGQILNFHSIFMMIDPSCVVVAMESVYYQLHKPWQPP